ncbi:MAG: hypothetical protein ACOX1X_05400 [Dethiobacteria bacterium]
MAVDEVPCAARQKVHGEARDGDNPAGRTPAAGHVTMDGNLAGKVGKVPG